METAYINMVGFSGEKLKIELSDKLKEKFKLECNKGEFYVVKKEPQYPRTYDECCKVLLLNPEKATYSVCGIEYKRHSIANFQRLLICRDAYWKIAGDWKPDLNTCKVTHYSIVNHGGNTRKCVRSILNEVLSFPTEKMRDTFYENFKELIEQCKELL